MNKIKQIYTKIKEKLIRFKKWVVILLIGTSAVTVGFVPPEQPQPVYQVLEWQRPTTDAEWAEDVKKESLNFRTDTELQEMLVAHKDKLISEEVELAKLTKYPDVLRAKFEEQGLEAEEVERQVNEKLANLKWGVDKLNQSIERMTKEIQLRSDNKVDRKPDIDYIGNSPYQKK
mgnify:CR=1 FL=1